MLKSILTFVVSIFLASSALAEPISVPASDIKELLSGNSIEGTWAGQKYKQFFDTSGSTTYAQKGSRETFGKWRINEQKNLYESWWERGGWSGYGVIRDGEKLYWTSSGLEPQPFEVIEGRDISWDD